MFTFIFTYTYLYVYIHIHICIKPSRGQVRHQARQRHTLNTLKVLSRTQCEDVRLPGKETSNSHGAGPVHLIITMMKWIRTSRLSIRNSLSLVPSTTPTHFRDYISRFTV